MAAVSLTLGLDDICTVLASAGMAAVQRFMLDRCQGPPRQYHGWVWRSKPRCRHFLPRMSKSDRNTLYAAEFSFTVSGRSLSAGAAGAMSVRAPDQERVLTRERTAISYTDRAHRRSGAGSPCSDDAGRKAG